MTRQILISAATIHELSPLLKQLQVKRRTDLKQGFILIEAALEGHEVMLMVTGAGIVNTAAGIAMIMERHPPDLIVQTGIAGIFRQSDLGIGDIVIADSEQYSHTGVGPECGTPPLAPLPFDLIADMPSTRTGRYPIDRTLAGEALSAIRNHLGATMPFNIITGPMITVSTLTSTPQEADRLFSLFRPCMEAMEGAAAAHVCLLYGTAFLEIRCGSNQTGIRDKASWNIPLAAHNSCLACVALIKELTRD